VRARRAAGYGIQRIAREMGMHRRTVRRYLATPGELVQLARVALQGQERPTRAVLVPRQPNVTPLQLRDERTELVDLQVDVGAQALFAELSRRLAHRGGRVVFVRWQERFYRVEDALRELRELGTDDITTMVVGRLADPSERREQALLTGWSVAEAFGAEGRDVLLIVDVPPAGLPELESLRARLRAAVGPGSITLLVFDLVLPSTGFESSVVVPSDWDAYIAFDLQLARRGLFPAIDPLASTSRLLRDGLVDPRHARVAGQVRALLEWSRAEHGDGPLGPEALSTRARRLELFQTQPFFVAEPWTARPGESVPFEHTLADYSALVDGAADTLPEEALRYVGRWRPTPTSEAPG